MAELIGLGTSQPSQGASGPRRPGPQPPRLRESCEPCSAAKVRWIPKLTSCPYPNARDSRSVARRISQPVRDVSNVTYPVYTSLPGGPVDLQTKGQMVVRAQDVAATGPIDQDLKEQRVRRCCQGRVASLPSLKSTTMCFQMLCATHRSPLTSSSIHPRRYRSTLFLSGVQGSSMTSLPPSFPVLGGSSYRQCRRLCNRWILSTISTWTTNSQTLLSITQSTSVIVFRPLLGCLAGRTAQ